MNYTYKYLFISLLISVTLISCSDDGEADSANSRVNMYLRGVSQKGPFVIGSSVTIQELNENFNPNGTSFQVATSDNLGAFELETGISTEYVEIICTGFYYNEVTGQNTNSNLTVRNISPVSENLSSNINILTTLARKRIINLVNDGGLSYETAKSQAEREVLLVFNISSETVEGFDQMDISGSNQSDAVLLGISIMLQGEGSVSDLSTLTSTIIEDIEGDGILDNASARDQIIQNAASISMPEVRANLINKYSELGLSIDVPDFETIISNVYENQPPIVTINSPIDGVTVKQGENITITTSFSDVDGEIKEMQIFLNDSLVATTTEFSWRILDLASPQSIRAMAIDDENGTTIDSIGFFVTPSESPRISFTSPPSGTELITGQIIEVGAEYSDEDSEIIRVSLLKNEEFLAENIISEPTSNSNASISWEVEGNGLVYLIAEAEDEFGTIERDTVEVNITPNQLPSIDMVSYMDGNKINYGSNQISIEVSDPDGSISRVDWYLNDILVGGFQANEESSVSINDVLEVSTTESTQVLRVDAIDNSRDTVSISVSLILNQGVRWNPYGDLGISVDAVGGDDSFFYFISNGELFRSTDGSKFESVFDEVESFRISTITILENPFESKLWMSITTDTETTIYTSQDQGISWSNIESSVGINKFFIFNNSLYAIEISTDFIYKWDTGEWSLVIGNDSPWNGESIIDFVTAVDFNNTMVVLESNLLTEERRVWVSEDLSNWTQSIIMLSNESTTAQNIISFDNYVWIFSRQNESFQSPDGVSWDQLITVQNGTEPTSRVINKDNTLYMFNDSGRIYEIEIFGN